MLNFDRDESPDTKLAKLEQALRTTHISLAESVPLLATLLSVPLEDCYSAPTLSPQVAPAATTVDAGHAGGVAHGGVREAASEDYRLTGELLQMAGGTAPHADLTPETCFRKALDIARGQQARFQELRVATSLARLWQSQGKHQKAYDLLTPVYEWFTEGFDTADLQEAKTLLEQLSEYSN